MSLLNLLGNDFIGFLRFNLNQFRIIKIVIFKIFVVEFPHFK